MGEVAYDPMAYLWRVLFVLALLFGLVFWLRRRWGSGRGPEPGRRLRLVESLALGPQRYVHLVAVGEREFLIGVTPQKVTFLSALPRGGDRPAGPPERAGAGADFQSILDAADERADAGDASS